MEKPFEDLAEALRDRLAVIHDEQSRRDETKHIARLKAVSDRIEKLQARLPKPVDPRLAHYLERRSYDKALEFLAGTTTANTTQQ
ncbi:MAG TPA: hypothetical protein VFA51_03380 [Candidatus Udaeobacter sp.]|nr:hypothetical protein [Candidatus Udaeobacter sp.]